MNGRYLVSIALLGLTACATSGPEAPVALAQAEAPVANSTLASLDGESVAAGNAKTGETTVVAPGDVRKCRKEKVTGSRIPKRICMTDNERQHLQEAAQIGMRGIKRTESAVPRRD